MKDQRYKAIKALFSTGGVDSVQTIFNIVPISVVQKDMGVNYSTLHRKVQQPELFNVRELMQMADLFDIDAVDLFEVIVIDLNKKKKKGR
ncbi:MAG: hypothetical protein JO154_14940 [Chitinophaga sp.]|uniref:hypothetical protein n=1 Tax=Chitinophaga sp. TaxID=1869181 RepID=UPI0025BCB98C|nr:hypothetical protein [Chitinophaga sp.]MBV8253897.1 hypothetical protein [Chitinophaga sp.]